MGRLQACKNFFKVEWKLLPLKLHFLLYSLGTASIMSYHSMIAKNVGISPTAAGILFTISPFLTVFTNPAFGWATDKLEKVTHVLIFLIIIQTPLHMGTAFIPPLKNETSPIPAWLICSSNVSKLVTFSNDSLLVPDSKSLKCSFHCLECSHLVKITIDNGPLCTLDVRLVEGGALNVSSDFLWMDDLTYQQSNVSLICERGANRTCELLCNIGDTIESKVKSEFLTYQYWTLLFLMVSSTIVTNATLAISDAGCFEALEGRVNKFGKQRVWLSIGWGAGTMISGYLLDLTAYGDNEKTDYRYSAYFMLILIIFDIIAMSQTKLKKPKASKQIFKDICNIFTKPHPFFFTTATLLIGMLSAISWQFQFWYLEDMGATKFLLGLSDAVYCAVVEALTIFIAGWIVKRIGRDNCMTLSFSTFAFWFLTISFINDPWWIILINLTQGPSYGLFFFTMSSYGKLTAAPGTEATMQTFLGSTYHGLGVGSGSLLVGILYDTFGGRNTYRFTGFVTVGLAVVYRMITYFVAGEDTVINKDRREAVDMDEVKSS